MSTVEHVVVYVTASAEQAPELAKALVQGALAACVNIVGGVRSIYRWQGEVCDEAESLLIIKTRAARLDALKSKIVELHAYDVAEIIALPIVDGNPPYLDWIDDSTRS